jgi:hypothetical protein
MVEALGEVEHARDHIGGSSRRGMLAGAGKRHLNVTIRMAHTTSLTPGQSGGPIVRVTLASPSSES